MDEQQLQYFHQMLAQNPQMLQEIVQNYQSGGYSIGGFSDPGSNMGFLQNRMGGRYAPMRMPPASYWNMVNQGMSMLRGSPYIPIQGNYASNISSYENQVAYTVARDQMLRQALFNRMNAMARSTAASRGLAYTIDDQNALASRISNPLAMQGAAALYSQNPDMFEGVWGSKGSGLGIFDAAYRSASYMQNEAGNDMSPGQRAIFAAQAMNMLYMDPEQRNRMSISSADAGEVWGQMSARGLMSTRGRDAPLPLLSVNQQFDVFRDYLRTVAPQNIDTEFGKTHQRYQRMESINDMRRELEMLDNVRNNSQLSAEERRRANESFNRQSALLYEAETANKVSSHRGPETTYGQIDNVIGLLEQLGKMREENRLRPNTVTLMDIDKKVAVVERMAKEGGVDIRGLDLYSDSTFSAESIGNLKRAMEATRNYRMAQEDMNKPIADAAIESELKKLDADAARLARESRTDSTAQKRLESTLSALEAAKLRGDQAAIESLEDSVFEQTGGNMIYAEHMRRRVMGETTSLNDDPELRRKLARESIAQSKLQTLEARRETQLNAINTSGLGLDGGVYDFSQFDLSTLVSTADMIAGIAESPQLQDMLRAAGQINSHKARLEDMNKAVKSLQEILLDKGGGIPAIMETISNFTGGNLYQADTTQLSHQIRQTFALANRMGQGEDYVRRSLALSQQMGASAQLNPLLASSLAMPAMAWEEAARSRGEYMGVWGASGPEELGVSYRTNDVSFHASSSGNILGALLRMRDQGLLIEGSEGEAYLRALESGQQMYEYTDSGGEIRKARTNISEQQARAIIARSTYNGENAITELLNTNLNQRALYENAPAVRQAQRGMRLSKMSNAFQGAFLNNLRGSQVVLDDTISKLEDMGLSKDEATEAVMTSISQVSRSFIEDMADQEYRESVVSRYGVDPNRLEDVIGVVLQERILTATKDAEDPNQVAALQAITKMLQSDKRLVTSLSNSGYKAMELAGTVATGERNLPNSLALISDSTARDAEKLQRMADLDAQHAAVYSGIFSDNMLVRTTDMLARGGITGLSESNVIEYILGFIDNGANSDFTAARKRMESWKLRVGEAQENLINIQNDRSLSEDERRTKVAAAQKQLDAYRRSYSDSQVVFRAMAQNISGSGIYDEATNSWVSGTYDLNIETLGQQILVEDIAGRLAYRQAREGELRMDESGRVLVRGEDDVYRIRGDEAYFQLDNVQDAQGNITQQYREVYYRDGKWQTTYDGGKSWKEIENNGTRVSGSHMLARRKDGAGLSTSEMNVSNIGGNLYYKDPTTNLIKPLINPQTGEIIEANSPMGYAIQNKDGRSGVVDEQAIKDLRDGKMPDIATVDKPTIAGEVSELDKVKSEIIAASGGIIADLSFTQKDVIDSAGNVQKIMTMFGDGSEQNVRIADAMAANKAAISSELMAGLNLDDKDFQQRYGIDAEMRVLRGLRRDNKNLDEVAAIDIENIEKSAGLSREEKDRQINAIKAEMAKRKEIETAGINELAQKRAMYKALTDVSVDRFERAQEASKINYDVFAAENFGDFGFSDELKATINEAIGRTDTTDVNYSLEDFNVAAEFIQRKLEDKSLSIGDRHRYKLMLDRLKPMDNLNTPEGLTAFDKSLVGAARRDVVRQTGSDLEDDGTGLTYVNSITGVAAVKNAEKANAGRVILDTMDDTLKDANVSKPLGLVTSTLEFSVTPTFNANWTESDALKMNDVRNRRDMAIVSGVDEAKIALLEKEYKELKAKEKSASRSVEAGASKSVALSGPVSMGTLVLNVANMTVRGGSFQAAGESVGAVHGDITPNSVELA